MGVLSKVAVRAVHAHVHVDGRHMHGLLELVRIVVGDDVPFAVQQMALPVLPEDGPEVPAVAVVVGELGVLVEMVPLGDGLQEFGIGPLTARCSAVGVPLVHLTNFRRSRVFLLFGPHIRRVGLVVPHGVAEVTVQEHVRLVHVAGHALSRRNGPAEGVANGVSRFILSDGGIHRRRLALVAMGGPLAGMARIPIVRIHHVARPTTRSAVVPGLLVGAEEPHERIVQARLRDVDEGHGNALPRARAPIGLADVGAPRLLQALNEAEGIGQPRFREGV